MKSGKLNSKWKWMRSGTSKMICRAYIYTSVTKGGLEKIWAHCSTRWGPWLHRTWKRLRYWMSPLPLPLTAALAFRGPSCQRPEGKCGARKMVFRRSFLVEDDLVRQYLRKLDIHKSIAPDGMYPQLLRELADVIARPLWINFDQSWRLEEAPEDWKKPNVTPILKKGRKEDPGN